MSNLLLDTHTLLWSLFSPERLSIPARKAILDPADEVLVSVASAWEIAIKQSIGKLLVPAPLETAVASSGFRFLGISPAHCRAYAALPLQPNHRDPFDRMLVVQSRELRCRLLSRDDKLDAYGVERIW